jgi:carbon-monoxide dehydrogenase large subunit
MAVETETVTTVRRYVGQSVKRVEDPSFLVGSARFVDDIALPGMLHAAFVRSPHAHARIISIDKSRALALDGVVAVYTADDLGLGPFVPNLFMVDGQLAPARDPLAKEKVRCVGDPIAVVVASTPYIAEDAKHLVDAEWERLPVVLEPEQALETDAPLLHESIGTNNIAHLENSAGDVDAAFEAADRVFSKRFRSGRSTGAPIGNRGVVAEYDGRQLTIYPTTQMPHMMRLVLAQSLGMPEGRITIRTPEVGGSFGVMCTIFPEDAVIPAVARDLGRPVKWAEDRWESLASGVHSKDMIVDMEIAVDDDGTFRAFRGHFITDAGAYSAMPFSCLSDSLNAALLLPSLYEVEDVDYRIDNPMTNKCQNGPIRGVGWTPGQLARETLIDDIARELRMSPFDLRAKNMIGPEPRKNAFGASYDGGSYVEAMEACRKAIGYESFLDRQTELRKSGRYVGIGISPYIEPTGLATHAVRAMGYANAGMFDTATVTMEPDGSVTVSTGQLSHGQGHKTTFAQVAADELGIPIEMVRVIDDDSDGSAWGLGTFASRGAVIGTGSIAAAAAEVRGRLKELAGSMLGASPEDVELRDAFASVSDDPARSVPIAQVAGFGYFGFDFRPVDVQRSGLTATSGYDPGESYGNGCAAAVVEVDTKTGIVTIEQIVAVEDCGVVLNPMVVAGQVAGAMAMGIGAALLEEVSYDAEGDFVSGSLTRYLYPTTTDVPMMTMQNIQTPSPVTVQGVKGVGEGGTIAAPAAVVNAIADALVPFGVVINRTPVTPMYLRELLRNRSV